MASRLLNAVGFGGAALALAGGVVSNTLFNVDGGHRAVIFDRFQVVHVTCPYYTDIIGFWNF